MAIEFSKIENVTISSGPPSNNVWLILTDYWFGAAGSVKIVTVDALGGITSETIDQGTEFPNRCLGIHQQVILSGNVRCVVRFFKPPDLFFEAVAQLECFQPTPPVWDPSLPPPENRRYNLVQIPPCIENGFVHLGGDRFMQILVAGSGFRVRDNNLSC
ncbi:MAG TPA: hypothetical protein PLX89_22385 [Verrucomicrobiota bacterium]|nr:hypothetical protein [Verrucomicrobiales bacterium]HRI15754.1 hypothetical protein [Verrucomicrobiota bacterium]